MSGAGLLWRTIEPGDDLGRQTSAIVGDLHFGDRAVALDRNFDPAQLGTRPYRWLDDPKGLLLLGSFVELHSVGGCAQE